MKHSATILVCAALLLAVPLLSAAPPVKDGFITTSDGVPDSSRFWPAEQYEPGRDQESFDKQYVRNHLTTLVEAGRWDKTPPGPELPDEIVANTTTRYREAVKRLTQ